MNSILRNIRLVISRAIAPATILSQETEQDRASDRNRIITTRNKQYAEVGHYDHRGQQIANRARGYFTSDDVADLQEKYARSAVANAAMWWAQLKLIQAVKDNNVHAQQAATGEWATWAEAGNILQDEAFFDKLALSLSKMSGGRPVKHGNDDTDALIAEARGCSVEVLRKNREAKYKAAVAAGKTAVKQALNALVSATADGHTHAMPAERAVEAIEKCMTWVSNWEGNPEDIAATLFLIKQDLAYARKLNVERHDQKFVDGVMAVDTITTRYQNADRDAELRTDNDQDEDEQPRVRRRVRVPAAEEVALDPLEILIAREEQQAA